MTERDLNPLPKSVVQEKESPSSQVEESSSPARFLSKTPDFLLDVVETKAYDNLDARRRNLISIYYGVEEATFEKLTSIAQVGTRERVRQLIRSAKKRLRQNLPPHLQEKYPEEEVIKLQKGFSPEYRAKMSEIIKERWQDPEYRAKISRACKEKWQDPEYMAKMNEALKGRARSPETRAKISEAHKRLWQDPGYRVKMSEISKKRWQDPQYRAKISRALKSRTHSPETKARMIEARRQFWKEKREKSP